MADPSSTAWGIDGMLVAAGVACAGVVGAAIWHLRRRAPAAEDPVRRAPSPSSVGLDEDPIVAALIRRRDGGGRRDRPPLLPIDDGPPT